MGALAHCDDGVDLLASPVVMTVADDAKEKDLTALCGSVGLTVLVMRAGRQKQSRASVLLECGADGAGDQFGSISWRNSANGLSRVRLKRCVLPR